MFAGLGGGELLIILFIVLLLFGGDRLVDLARNMGRAVSEFKKGMREIDATAPPAPPSPAEIAMNPPRRDLPAGDATHAGGHH